MGSHYVYFVQKVQVSAQWRAVFRTALSPKILLEGEDSLSNYQLRQKKPAVWNNRHANDDDDDN